MIKFYETESPTLILNIKNVVKALKELIGDNIEIYVFCERVEKVMESTRVHLGFAIDYDINRGTINIKTLVGNKTKIFKFSKIISYNCDNNSTYDDMSTPEPPYSTFIKQTRIISLTSSARELGLLKRFSMTDIVYEK
jgi:hypothetical protein